MQQLNFLERQKNPTRYVTADLNYSILIWQLVCIPSQTVFSSGTVPADAVPASLIVEQLQALLFFIDFQVPSPPQRSASYSG